MSSEYFTFHWTLEHNTPLSGGVLLDDRNAPCFSKISKLSRSEDIFED